MHSLRLLALSLALAAIGIACQDTPVQQPAAASVPVSCVHPPIPELDPALERFSLDAAKGGTLRLPSGTQIQVPPSAWVDESGTAVQGAVTLRYRELHDAVSVYLAGIPMEYGGGHFTTAGSFEIRANQGEKELELAPGKSVHVRMASMTGGDDYDFFQLDEQSGQWDSLGTAPAEVNRDKKRLARRIRELSDAQRRFLVLDYNAVLDVMYDEDLAKADQLKANKKAAAYGLGWAGIKNYQWIEVAGKWEFAPLMVWKNLDQKPVPAWTKGRTGALEAIEGNQYLLSVEDAPQNRKFQVRLEALMPLKSLFAFAPDDWNKRYNETLAQIRAEQERWRKMAECFRTFELAGMGIYNWDKLLNTGSDPVFVRADFDFGQNLNRELHDLTAVFISGDGKVVIKLPQESWERLTLIDDPGGRLFVLLPGNIPAVYPPAQYRKLPLKQLRGQDNPSYRFAMVNHGKPLQSEADLRRMLGI